MSAAKRQWDAQQSQIEAGNLAAQRAQEQNSNGDFAKLLERPMTTIKFDPQERKLVLDTCCGGATREEADQLIAIAEARGLNPITGECYFVKRWDSQKRREVWSVQASIDAFRIKAEESGLYEGQDEPEYEYNEDGSLKLARVRIYRRDWPRPAVGVARFDEYVQKTTAGDLTRFWKTMPHNQLAKCAEAIGFRKAFPKRLAKLYVPEEMAQANNGAPSHDPVTGEVHELQAFLDLRDAIEAAATLVELAEAWKRGTKGMTPAQKSELTRRKDRKKAELSAEPPPDVDAAEERQPGED